MSEILERLSDFTIRFAHESEQQAAIRRNKLVEEAKDRIAALEAENKALQHDLNGAKGNVKNLLPTVDYWKAQTKRLEAENERLRKTLEPFAKVAGMMPLTHGPNNEPVSDDEPVSVSCCGFYLGDLTAADLNAVFNLEAKP